MNKLIAKQNISGKNGVVEIGGEIEVPDENTTAYIEKGIAEFKNKKDLDSFIKRFKKLKSEKEESEAKAKAILEKSRIQNELNSLYENVVKKEAELNGEVLSDDEVLNAVEALSKRDAVDSEKAKGK